MVAIRNAYRPRVDAAPPVIPAAPPPLAQQILDFCARTGISRMRLCHEVFGWNCRNNPVARIIAGRAVRPSSARRVRDYIEAHR